ncbi:PREDICTED: proline-rich protein 23D1-like [Hipposideros armiger]|uniref:Proline-rich protein 23D1-like n=1 Tax=Hipposideros armiger TaxID=186990 RepID=A0A8B7RZN6_HIPAR|nr:PREDICTED: proline-rich protein 23D1-like [Hipposideros armiger]
MYGFRRPQSPSDSQTEWKDNMAGQSRGGLPPPIGIRQNVGMWNRIPGQVQNQLRCKEFCVQIRRWPPSPPTPMTQSFSLPQGRQIPSTHMIVVILEPGTDLHLRLGDEVLVLAPQTALQLSLSKVTVVVVPEHVLRLSEDLRFPAHARLLLPRGADTTWGINIEDGSLSAQHAHVPRAEEEGEAAPGLQPAMGPSAYRVPAFSPPPLSTLLLRPLYRAAARRGCSGLPRPRPGRRPLPAEFSLDLHGLRPCPGSALRPLPPSPSPGPRTCRAVRRRPPSKARRRLF